MKINRSFSHIARLEVLAAISGFMIALQSRANGELSNLLGNSTQAALVSFGSGLIVISIIAPFNRQIKVGIRNLRLAIKTKELPRWRLFAGVLGGSFVALQTQVVPLIGVALYSVASIAGQTATSLVVDRIGLTGGGKKLISKRRVASAGITVFAVFISALDRISIVSFSIFALVLATLAGVLVGIQRALNGQINEHTKASFTTSFLNFFMGTSTLVILLFALLLFKGDAIVALPSGPWWIYSGGTIGVIYIAFTSTIVQHLGVLTFTLFSVGGTLVGSLLIDIFSPTNGNTVSWYLVLGIAIAYLGVLTGGQSSLFKR
ncbi:MAG: DMT family transporter [Actinomycetota bacterium]